jgi:hypothetical protein
MTKTPITAPQPTPTKGIAETTAQHLATALSILLFAGVLGAAAGHARAGATVGAIAAAAWLLICTSAADIHDLAEQLTRRDLDGDGDIGGERIILVNKQPPPASRWPDFVRAAAIDPTERRLLAQGFTDRQISAYRNALISANLARWTSTDHRHGWTLTSAPDAILRSLAEPEEETTP